MYDERERRRLINRRPCYTFCFSKTKTRTVSAGPARRYFIIAPKPVRLLERRDVSSMSRASLLIDGKSSGRARLFFRFCFRFLRAFEIIAGGFVPKTNKNHLRRRATVAEWDGKKVNSETNVSNGSHELIFRDDPFHSTALHSVTLAPSLSPS